MSSEIQVLKDDSFSKISGSGSGFIPGLGQNWWEIDKNMIRTTTKTKRFGAFRTSQTLQKRY